MVRQRIRMEADLRPTNNIYTESVFTFLGHCTSFHRFVSLSQSGQGSVDFIIHAVASICTYVRRRRLQLNC